MSVGTVSIYIGEAEDHDGDLLIQLISCLLAHLLEILTTPSRTHCPRIIFPEYLIPLLQLQSWVFPGNYYRAARFSGHHLGSFETLSGAWSTVLLDGGVRGGVGRRGGGVGDIDFCTSLADAGCASLRFCCHSKLYVSSSGNATAE